MGLRRADSGFGRRQFLRRVMAAGAGAGLAIFDALHGLPGRTAAQYPGVGRVAGAANPQRPPGSPPDKQTTSGITVPASDPTISAGPVEYPGIITPITGYLAAPAGGEIYPGVLVLHDVYGLTEHCRDVTRRLAKAGYVSLAPDLLSRRGGTAKLGDPAKIGAALGSLVVAQYLEDMNSSVRYLESRPLAAKTRIGVVGFGLGGNLAWALLAQHPDLKAGVMLYGGIPANAVVERIKAPVLAIFGEAEQQDTSEISELDAAIKKTGVSWAYKTEPKANRGFFDDTRDRYVPAAAQDAWKMTLDWLGKYVRA